MPRSAGDVCFGQYEAKLKRAGAMAFIANVMYGLNWFLGFCALTWASAVILGGLISSLTQHDYYSVVALLLLEAVRLSTTTFFGKFVTWRLVGGSADPQRLVYHDATRQKLQGIARMLEQALQLTVFAITILVPIRRLHDLNVLAAIRDRTSTHNFDGTGSSLRIFYVLVFINGAIAGSAVIFSKNVVPFFVDSFSLRKYYEKIVWRGMDEGLLHATDFEFLSWTFQMQAEEYRRNVRPLVVKDLYGDMMKFLLYHPRRKGFEAAKVALDSDDTFEREAAANIVGLWVMLAAEVEESDGTEKADKSQNESAFSSVNIKAIKSHNESASNVNQKRGWTQLFMQTKLLAKLADALDNDESGRAATSSFEKLATSDPEGTLMVRSAEKGEKVADIFMDHIHRTIELRRGNNALVYIKAMIPLLSYLKTVNSLDEHGIAKYCTPAKVRRLKEDLWIIVCEFTGGLKRLQAVAAYAYDCLSSEEGSKREELCTHLMKKPTVKGTHILKDELEYLFKLTGWSELPIEWGDAIEVRPIIEERKTLPLPYLARPTTALIASLVSTGVLVVSCMFMMRYAHF